MYMSSNDDHLPADDFYTMLAEQQNQIGAQSYRDNHGSIEC